MADEKGLFIRCGCGAIFRDSDPDLHTRHAALDFLNTHAGCARSEWDGDLPKHFPMGVTETGQGPATHTDVHHHVCWCGSESCQWTQALAAERVLEERRWQEKTTT